MRQLSLAITRLQRPERIRFHRELMRLEHASRAELEALSRDGLTRILRHACANVPFYRDACRNASIDPATVDARDLAAFPLVTKTIMTDGGKAFHDETADATRFVPTATGGSSGVWFQFFVDARTTELRKASDLRGRTWTGWRLGDKQAVLWGHAGDNRRARSLRGRLLANLVHRSRTLNVYNMDDADLRAYYEELRAFAPRMILGYASAVAFFADYMAREGLRFPQPSGIITSAETLTDDHRRSIEGYFACPVLNRYGSREFGVIAQQCRERGGLHAFIDRVHLEILRPDGSACAPGERGEIVVTDLDNRAMPFLRYRTGDLAVVSTDTCACGRGFPLLASVDGRTSELIVGLNGKYYSCQSPRLFGAEIPGIGQMQLIQERIDAITVRVVPDGKWNDDSHARLTARMKELLGDVEVEIRLEQEIPVSPSGKYQFTISHVSPFRS